MGMCYLPGPRSMPFVFKTLGAGTLSALGEGVFTTASDKNLKIEKYVLSPKESFEAVLKLRPLAYEWREGTSQRAAAGNSVALGFFAQEVNEVEALRSVVSLSSDGTYGLHYHALTAPLVASIQHLHAELVGLQRSQLEMKTVYHDTVNQLIADGYQQNELLKKQIGSISYALDSMEHRVKAISPSDPSGHFHVLKSEFETLKRELGQHVSQAQTVQRVMKDNLQGRIAEIEKDLKNDIGILRCNVTNLSQHVHQTKWQRFCGWFRGLFA